MIHLRIFIYWWCEEHSWGQLYRSSNPKYWYCLSLTYFCLEIWLLAYDITLQNSHIKLQNEQPPKYILYIGTQRPYCKQKINQSPYNCQRTYPIFTLRVVVRWCHVENYLLVYETKLCHIFRYYTYQSMVHE